MASKKKVSAKKTGAKRTAKLADKRPKSKFWKVYDVTSGEFIAGDYDTFADATDRADLEPSEPLAVAGPYALMERKRQK